MQDDAASTIRRNRDGAALTPDLDIPNARKLLEGAARRLRWIEDWADCRAHEHATAGEVTQRLEECTELARNALAIVGDTHGAS